MTRQRPNNRIKLAAYGSPAPDTHCLCPHAAAYADR
jgi:hypothetical protein